jgi:hypothetical protein
VKIVSSAERSARGQSDSIIESPAASFIELCLAGGRHLMVRRGFDRQLLLEVIDALEHRPPTTEARS